MEVVLKIILYVEGRAKWYIFMLCLDHFECNNLRRRLFKFHICALNVLQTCQYRKVFAVKFSLVCKVLKVLKNWISINSCALKNLKNACTSVPKYRHPESSNILFMLDSVSKFMRVTWVVFLVFHISELKEIKTLNNVRLQTSFAVKCCRKTCYGIVMQLETLLCRDFLIKMWFLIV